MLFVCVRMMTIFFRRIGSRYLRVKTCMFQLHRLYVLVLEVPKGFVNVRQMQWRGTTRVIDVCPIRFNVQILIHFLIKASFLSSLVVSRVLFANLPYQWQVFNFMSMNFETVQIKILMESEGTMWRNTNTHRRKLEQKMTTHIHIDR